jgi:glyoxylase-like metal-dependent hydrolase (beta-lactamase superfamily II)
MMAANCGGWQVQLFELTFLGTAAAVPSTERGLPALVVVKGSSRFLIDCGEGTQRQLVRAQLGFRGLGHVLLTHAHLVCWGLQASSPCSLSTAWTAQ